MVRTFLRYIWSLAPIFLFLQEQIKDIIIIIMGSTLGVYSFGLIFVSAKTNKRHHHQCQCAYVGWGCNLGLP
jgi:hypothetical protein